MWRQSPDWAAGVNTSHHSCLHALTLSATHICTKPWRTLGTESCFSTLTTRCTRPARRSRSRWASGSTVRGSRPRPSQTLSERSVQSTLLTSACPRTRPTICTTSIILPTASLSAVSRATTTSVQSVIRSRVRHLLMRSSALIDPLDFDAKCDGSLPLESILKPDPSLRKLLQDIDRTKVRVWALTNAYVNVSEVR
jgi:hypothetical protein